jgi:soluble lytic murein transglycosylase-like protein
MMLVAFGLQGAPPDPAPTRITTVVRADTRSGRLIRSTVVASRVVPQKVVSTAPPPPPAAPKASPEPSVTVNELVANIARRHDVEPSLVDSVIRVESNYNPNAVSSAGAMGLMQLIPSTARRFGVNNTFHPEQNIEGGVRYLKYLMQLYNGDERLALAAYNAGEGAVAKYGAVPPYKETQNYLHLVADQLKKLNKAAEGAGPAQPVNQPAETAPDGLKHMQPIVDRDGSVRYVSR